MRIVNAIFTLAGSVILFGGLVLPAQNVDQAPKVSPPPEVRWYERLQQPYRAPHVSAPEFRNSDRIGRLLRAGKLYLTLQDAIALALENNLDIELERYVPGMADSDLLRAKGGGMLRGVPLTVSELPQGVGGPASPLLNTPASGVTTTSSVPANLNELNSITALQTNSSIVGATPLATGPPVPVFDPALTGQLQWQHQTTPQPNAFVAGTNSLVGRTLTGNFGLQKGFALGTQISTSFNNNSQQTNSVRNSINPYTASNLGIAVIQPLLRGFGFDVNRRFIRIAKNNQRVSDLVFRQQIISTVAGVIRLYWDLVSLGEDVKVKQQTLALARKLYDDNQAKVEAGTLAPIELVRAQAQVAASREDLANSEGFQLQQELILKTILTRRGTADPVLREARIVALDPIDIPVREEVRPVQDLIEEARTSRPELESARLQIENSEISLKGSRNALLPQIDLFGIAQNSGLSGQPNRLSLSDPGANAGTSLTVNPDQNYIGGYGTGLGQIFRRDFPTYGLGLQINLPLRNRLALGDVIRDEMQIRQTQVREQQLENQVRLEVESALISLHRARSAYEAAVDTRKLQEQSLEIELDKYANGLSTNFLVLQYQGYVAQARSTEVAAKGVYVKARAALERATGETLQNHNISIDEVFHGHITREPNPLPVEPGSAAASQK